MNIEPGILPAVVTPLNEDETIDTESLERLVEHLLRTEVKGLFMGGTMGEGGALRDSEKAALYRETVRFARGRVPVLASVSDQGTRRVIDNVRLAEAGGVDAVVLTPRLCFPQRGEDESVRLVEAVARDSSVPVWFYENPEVSPVTSRFEILARIAALPNVGGLKLTTKDRVLFQRCLTEIPEKLPCFNGVVSEIAFAASIGGGAISGIGSMLPGLCIRVFNAAKAGEMDEAKRYQDAINATYAIYNGAGWPLWPSAQKHVLKRLGILRTSVATAPFLRLGPEEERAIDAVLDTFEDWILEPARVV
ncbi:MAG: dihydrodipicolinate synthase family protein [Opitutales bacterium]|nr:dihydrodipicolinate synthase family protein [Opitutales bacterium]